MKKILKFIRGVLILIGWSCAFIIIYNLLMFAIWHFNLFSARSWELLETFWNSGGVLKTTSDILLILCLMLLPLIWFIGYILALKLNYITIFFFPLKLIYNLFNRTPNQPNERIVIKNLQSSQQAIEEIKSKLDSFKPAESKQAGNIRSEILQKLSQKIKS